MMKREEEWLRIAATALFLWTAAVPDLRTKRIPVRIPALFLSGVLAVNLFLPSGMESAEMWAGVIPGLLLLLLSFITEGKIGEGDGICLMICGLCTGISRAVLLTETAFVLVGAAAAAAILSKRCRAEESLPFVPFLAAAASLLFVCALF